MSISTNFDFCIINNPFKDDEYILFVTKKGKTYLDRTIINDNNYNKVTEFIEGLGYIESEILTFEFPTNSNKLRPKSTEIKDILLEKGMSYNKKLEKNIYRDFNILMEQSREPMTNLLSLHGLYNNNDYPIEAIKPKKNVPAIGEKIKLYFYLFLECKFITQKECLVSFGGNFISNIDMPTRNYMQKVESEFIRVENIKNKNSIILKSCKNNEDFLKEIDYLKSGAFQYVNTNMLDKNNQQHIDMDMFNKDNPNNILTRTYIYSIVEIMHNINSKGRVIIEIEDNLNFDEMLYFSNKIKREKKTEKNNLIDILPRKKESKELIKILEHKMEHFSNLEEYEKALLIKKDLQFVIKKDKELENLRREKMPILEYRKKFHLQ